MGDLALSREEEEEEEEEKDDGLYMYSKHSTCIGLAIHCRTKEGYIRQTHVHIPTYVQKSLSFANANYGLGGLKTGKGFMEGWGTILGDFRRITREKIGKEGGGGRAHAGDQGQNGGAAALG